MLWGIDFITKVISLATPDYIICMAGLPCAKLMMTIHCWPFNMWIYITIRWKEKKNDWIHYCTIPWTFWLAYLGDVRGWDSKNPPDATLPSLIIKYESVWLLLKSSSKLPTQNEYLHNPPIPPTTDKGERKNTLSVMIVCYTHDWILWFSVDYLRHLSLML